MEKRYALLYIKLTCKVTAASKKQLKIKMADDITTLIDGINRQQPGVEIIKRAYSKINTTSQK